MQSGRLALFTLALFALLASVNSQRPFLRAIWSSWKRVNGKRYPTPKEEHLRLRIFTQNYMFSRWHNERYYLGLETYTTALNQFADLTIKEFADQYLTLVPRNRFDSFFGRSRTRFFNPFESSPDTVDWRKKGYVTDIKDQVWPQFLLFTCLYKGKLNWCLSCSVPTPLLKQHLCHTLFYLLNKKALNFLGAMRFLLGFLGYRCVGRTV